MIDGALAGKYARLREILQAAGPVAIAFSGGVDSSFLLRVAHDISAGQVTAFFADSQVQPVAEREAALAFAQGIGVPLEVISFDLLAYPRFRENSAERCYFCKKKIFSAILESCSHKNLLDGTNLDDLREVRPGFKACRELGVRSPLLDADLTKADIRLLSRELGLATWNKPSASCLATRIAVGYEIMAADLAKVEQGEEWLHAAGFIGCRLRLQEQNAFIELAAGDICRFTAAGTWSAAVKFMYSLGLKKVFLDLSERECILS